MIPSAPSSPLALRSRPPWLAQLVLAALSTGCVSSADPPGAPWLEDGGVDGGGGPAGLLPPSLAPEVSYCPFSDAADLTSFEGRDVIRVCHAGDTRSGCDVDTLQEAVDRAGDGDRIEIVGDGPVYDQCANIGRGLQDIEIAGVCGRAHLSRRVCSRKGAFVIGDASGITITNIEVSYLTISEVDGGNAAAVRDQGQGGLALRYVYFHDNQNGILGGAGRIDIDWSKFEANGGAASPGYTHNTYFSDLVTEVNIRNSVFLRAANQGNNLKSRAERLTFHCSVSASLDGDDSREMDISEGGELEITNSLIQQGPESVNRNIIGFATEAGNESRRHAIQSVVIRDTMILNDSHSGTMLAYNAFNGLTLDMANVRFVGPGTPVTNLNGGDVSLGETGREEQPNRDGVGLPAYSEDHRQLPRPEGCPDFEYW